MSLVCPTPDPSASRVDRAVEVVGERTVSIRPAAVFFAPRKSKLACTPPGPSTASLGFGK